MYFTNQNILQSITGHILSISLFNPSIPVEIIAKKIDFNQIILRVYIKSKEYYFQSNIISKSQLLVNVYIHLPKLCYVPDLYTDSNIIQHQISV